MEGRSGTASRPYPTYRTTSIAIERSRKVSDATLIVRRHCVGGGEVKATTSSATERASERERVVGGLIKRGVTAGRNESKDAAQRDQRGRARERNQPLLCYKSSANQASLRARALSPEYHVVAGTRCLLHFSRHPLCFFVSSHLRWGLRTRASPACACAILLGVSSTGEFRSVCCCVGFGGFTHDTEQCTRRKALASSSALTSSGVETQIHSDHVGIPSQRPAGAGCFGIWDSSPEQVLCSRL